jgi:hypothetical protein
MQAIKSGNYDLRNGVQRGICTAKIPSRTYPSWVILDVLPMSVKCDIQKWLPQRRTASQRGEQQLVIDDAGSLQNLVDVGLELAPANKPAWYPVVLACRQAGMFVNYLRESDGPAFDRMMNAILDGHAFAEAVTIGYHDDVRSLWQKFIKSSSDQK